MFPVAGVARHMWPATVRLDHRQRVSTAAALLVLSQHMEIELEQDCLVSSTAAWLSVR